MQVKVAYVTPLLMGGIGTPLPTPAQRLQGHRRFRVTRDTPVGSPSKRQASPSMLPLAMSAAGTPVEAFSRPSWLVYRRVGEQRRHRTKDRMFLKMTREDWDA